MLTGAGPSAWQKYPYPTKVEFRSLRSGDWKLLYTAQGQWFNGVVDRLVTWLIVNLALDPSERSHTARGLVECQENRTWIFAPSAGVLQKIVASCRNFRPRQGKRDLCTDAKLSPNTHPTSDG